MRLLFSFSRRRLNRYTTATMVYSPVFSTPPPAIDFNDEVLLTFPHPHILLLTLNRPGAYSSLSPLLSLTRTP